MNQLNGFLFFLCFVSFFPNASADNRPLFSAIDAHNSQAVTKAIEQGADVNAVRYNASALEWAFVEKDIDSAKVLVEAGASYENMNKLMIQAIGSPESMAYLIALGADPNMNVMGMSLINSSVSENCKSCVKTLVAAGGDPKLQSNKGQTALFIVPMSINSRNDGEAMTELLLSYGLDINHSDASGMTPLAKAVQERKVDYVSYLISKGADPNVLDKKRRPIAYYAWTSNYPLSFKDSFPLKSLSNVNLVEVMNHHLSNGNEDVVAYLLEHGVEIIEPMTWLEYQIGRSAAIIYMIMGAYPDLNLDEALVKVSTEDKPRFARALIRHGATASKLGGYEITQMMQNGLAPELYAVGVSQDLIIREADEYGDAQTLKDWAIESGYQDSLKLWSEPIDSIKEKHFLNVKLGTSETKLLQDFIKGDWIDKEGDFVWSFDESGHTIRKMSFFGRNKEAKGKWVLTNSSIQVTWDKDGQTASFAIADIAEGELIIESRGDLRVYKKQ